MNFDEPYELGHGKSWKKVQETSIEEVYIEYFNILADDVRKYNKIPMLWGDVLVKHPEKFQNFLKMLFLLIGVTIKIIPLKNMQKYYLKMM